MGDFLGKDYKAPVYPSNYMKFEDGENTFRVLSSAVTGFSYWTTSKKPVRSKMMFEETPDDAQLSKEGKFQPKHFWAFVVWNYKAERVQILELTQKSIQDAILALVNNKKWGDPVKYDITVSKAGEGLDTEYTVMPNPHSPADGKWFADAEAVNVQALFSNGDPFTKDSAPVESKTDLQDGPNPDDIPF